MTLLWHGKPGGADAPCAELCEGDGPDGAIVELESGRFANCTRPGSPAGPVPIGICVFVSPPMSLRPRNEFFGHSGRWDRMSLVALNRQLVLLQRVVLHPTYRGAGIAADFIRRSCELCPFPWIETLTQLGHVHPVFEQAGFIRVGVTGGGPRSRAAHSAVWGGRKRGQGDRLVSEETHEKSRWARPVYYLFGKES